MAVVAGVIFFATRALLALICADQLSLRNPISESRKPAEGLSRNASRFAFFYERNTNRRVAPV